METKRAYTWNTWLLKAPTLTTCGKGISEHLPANIENNPKSKFPFLPATVPLQLVFYQLHDVTGARAICMAVGRLLFWAKTTLLTKPVILCKRQTCSLNLSLPVVLHWQIYGDSTYSVQVAYIYSKWPMLTILVPNRWVMCDAQTYLFLLRDQFFTGCRS